MQQTQINSNVDTQVDMAALLEQYGAPVQPTHGQLIQGTVVRIDSKLGAWIDFGGKSDAILPSDELEDAKLEVGDKALFQVVQTGEDSDDVITVSHKRARTWQTMNEHRQSGESVTVRVTRVVRNAGVRVRAGHLDGFVPASLLGFRKGVEDLVDKELEVKVFEVIPEKRRLIFDHATVRRERAERYRAAEAAREQRFNELKVGQVIDGTVAKTAEYGVFVEIGGGLNGLLHNKALGQTKLAVGESVKVRITRANKDAEGKRRVALALVRQAQRSAVYDTLTEGDIVAGTVSKVVPFGLFVTVSSDGTEGLVHRTELPDGVNPAAGEGVRVRVLAVDKTKGRISLSLKDIPSESDAPVAAPETTPVV
jgi:small subunit ribosomal protein S1